METTYTSLIGTKKDRLTIVGFDLKHYNGHNQCFLKCICDCGRNREYRYYTFIRKESVACVSCIRSISADKGKKSTTEIYGVHLSMISRCYNKSNKNYFNYGGRGISVCDRWLNSLDLFISDMGDKPTGNYTLDRINNNGNYEPTNCRWATKAEQAENRRNTQLTLIQCLDILDKNTSGKSYTVLSKEFGVDRWIIQRAVLRARKNRAIKSCKLTFSTIQKMYYNAMWAADAAQSQGIISEALRYFKIATRLEKAMWNYPSVNSFKS